MVIYLKRMKIRYGFIAVILIVTMLAAPVAAFGSKSTVLTFTLNRQGRLVRTQDAYLPDRNITTLGLESPENIAFDQNDLLYIADTGNRRVVVFDTRADEVVREIRHDRFHSPRGVFVTPEGLLYVADSAAGIVFIFDDNGEYVRHFVAPETLAFGDADTPFMPYRIAVDVRGNMFIVSEGVADGIIQLSNEGEFLGFFASNQATLTFLQLLQDIFFTDRQREGLADRIPPTFSNVFADHRGVIYATAMGPALAMRGEALRRHDMAGRNTIETNVSTIDFIDLTVDGFGNIFVATASGFIFVYTNSGEFIFTFGTAGEPMDIAGHFRLLVSIAISSEGHIWALDGELGSLQSFTPTEYALSIFRAISLFNAGHYDASAYEWTEVLRYNQMSVLAHLGLGRSYLYQQQFQQARESFRLAGARTYYSNAFWEVRNIWLLDNLPIVLISVVVFFSIMSAIRHLDRKRVVRGFATKAHYAVMNARYLKNIMFAFSVARHPLDSFYYLKIGEKGSLAGATVHFILFFIAYMVFQTSRGFMVQMAEIADMDFNIIIGGFFGVFIIFVVSNYLVTSIKDGEGSISDIFKLLSYGLFPLTLTLLLVTLLSHGVTDNELFLLTFVMMFGVVWTVVIIWLGLQEIHNYSFGTTFKSLMITAGFMLICIVVLFNFIILFNEIFMFGDSIVREVYANVTGMY